MITVTRKHSDDYEWIYINNELVHSGYIIDASAVLSALKAAGVIEYKSEWVDDEDDL